MTDFVDVTQAEALEREVAALLRRLIGCDTSNPPGGETQAAAILEDYLTAAGLHCERVAKDEARANLLVRLPGTGTGPSLAFLGHLDVVPARREDWSVEPFAAIERDGIIWGRGAVDMKCQVAATAVALATLAREGFEPNGDLMLVLMADEEVGESGVGSPFFVEARPDLCPDYIVGEGAGERFTTPSGPVYLLDCGVKATASATLTVHGRAGDASLPDAGIDALTEMSRLLARLDAHRSPVRIPAEIEPVLQELGGAGNTPEERLAPPPAAPPGPGPGPRAPGGTGIPAPGPPAPRPAHPGPPTAVAARAPAPIECIVLPATTREDLEAELRAALGPGRYELDVVAPRGGRVSPPDTPLRDAIEEFLAEHDPEARLLPALGYGYSDCDQMRKEYGSIAYGFIPFRHVDPMVNLDAKHGVDERVLVDDLVFQTQAALHVARVIGALHSAQSQAA